MSNIFDEMDDGMGKFTESYTENKFKDKIVKEICTSCDRETRHAIVTSYELNAEEDCGGGYTIDMYSSFQVIQCQGCSELSFRNEQFFSENVHQISEDEWDDGTSVTLYPKRTIHMRSIKDFFDVPHKLRNIYIESISAYNNDSYILAAAGIRALVEGLCSHLGIKDGPVVKEDGTVVRKGNLEGKIFGLSEKGYFTAAGAKFLHEHRFMGNDAVHALKRPRREDLYTAIDLIEHTIEAIFVLPAKAEELEESRERRNNSHKQIK